MTNNLIAAMPAAIKPAPDIDLRQFLLLGLQHVAGQPGRQLDNAGRYGNAILFDQD